MADDVRMTTTVSSTFFALLRLLHRVFENIGLNEVLQDVAKVVCEVTGATAAKVYFYDESSSTLRSRVALGPSVREIAMPVDGKGFVAYCLHFLRSSGEKCGLAAWAPKARRRVWLRPGVSGKCSPP